MGSIADFTASVAVDSGVGSPSDYDQSIQALDAYLAQFGPADQPRALRAALQALSSLKLTGETAAAARAEIVRRLEGMT
ncbi:hypothetical protein ACFSCV_08700 [Methylopila henanensis]|uniref:DUF2783 domain-containing protein n=1 Tax=Methylopila henanensis TaxID=873516 RepID=A0ABW4K4M3_9HYPH